MSQTLVPARVSSPGRILSRELDARGWTQKDLAVIVERPPQTINEIVKGKKQITPETAMDLAAALGTSAEFWTNLEANYRLHLAQKEAGQSSGDSSISRRGRLYSLAPIPEMVKRGWIEGADSIDKLEKAVCDFFGVVRIEEAVQLAVNCRQSEVFEAEGRAQIAWVKRVENLVRNREVAVFDRAKLRDAIPDLLEYARKAEDVALVPQKLASLGVHFAIVPHLQKTYLDGAAFYVEGTPVVALTLRHKRIDNFWFTLMHELGHIVAGHKGSYLDNMENLAVTEEEAEANQLAADWLLEPQDLSEFVAETSPYFSTKKVQQFSISQNRHPGILAGRLHREELIPYKNHRKFLVKVDRYLEGWIAQ
ncbi:HigA family addiction module antitoxin [Synechococcus sp. PCC 7336]|uniref:HigA family addiction module antitoxin n=1 Tax=Synechococcus sp. PCC 7336 TaxID=195250 RepID=UPI00034BA354|nr:HigA family addiction module antitoxin [Synechococcus sp. PCC 7336]